MRWAATDDSPETLRLYAKYAHVHVVDTRVEWGYDQEKSEVWTTYEYTTLPMEGSETHILFALYPHQWRNTDHPLLPLSYHSVRGTMRVAEGDSFTTRMRFPGVLPGLPDLGASDKSRLRTYVGEELHLAPTARDDTYWTGKYLGKLATLSSIAEVAGDVDAAGVLGARLKEILKDWFTAAGPDGAPKTKQVFYYDRNWGTIVGYPASYGSDSDLNDHHFHYGYFIRAAAEVARRDRAWAGESNWGEMVELLVRDIASPDRGDEMFPFLRNFDVFAGHSWASGNARFEDGNNQESSSEAMNACTGLILWGEATSNKLLRDLGIYLYTTEMNAIHEYWFDCRHQNFPADYEASKVTFKTPFNGEKQMKLLIEYAFEEYDMKLVETQWTITLQLPKGIYHYAFWNPETPRDSIWGSIWESRADKASIGVGYRTTVTDHFRIYHSGVPLDYFQAIIRILETGFEGYRTLFGIDPSRRVEADKIEVCLDLDPNYPGRRLYVTRKAIWMRETDICGELWINTGPSFLGKVVNSLPYRPK